MSTKVSQSVAIELGNMLTPAGKTILAKRLNVSYNAVNMWLNGKRGMKRSYFDEGINIVREQKAADKQIECIVNKLKK